VRLDIRKVSAIKEGEDVTGGRVKVKVVKNKVAPPFRAAEFDIMFNEGVSKLGEIIDLGVDKNIVEKSGAWFSYSGTRIGQGRENVKQFLAEHPDMASEIELKVRQASGLTVPNVPVAQNPAPAAEKEAAPPAERSSRSSKAQKTEKHVEA
jgi:recombination protein RecA